MMRIYICQTCGKSRAISKFLQAECFDCGTNMVTCKTPYIKWVELSLEERAKIIEEYKKKP